MKHPAVQKAAIATAAGPRLRCFLGHAFMLMLLCGFIHSPAHAQLEADGPIHLTRVQGIVANTSGQRVAGAAVTLSRDGKALQTTHTDSSGAFRFDHASGRLTLEVARTQNAPAAREIIATDEIVTLLERKMLYVIVGPGACADACSSVFTSKSDFDRALKRTSRK